jgi:NitT/TauT family transport system substrate-binding protein
MRRFGGALTGVLCMAGAVTLLLAGCSRTETEKAAADGSKPLQKLRFRMDWYPQAEHGGFYQALAKGYYRDAGLDVDIIPGGPGPTMPQWIAAGTTDLAMGASDGVITYVNEGLPVVIVGAYMEHDPQAILVHDESPVKRFEDLNGRTVMAIPGSDWIDYVKAQYHIDFRLIPGNYGIAQFMADPNFIQQCFVTNEPYFVARNGGHPRAMLIADSGFDPYRSIFSTTSFAREHPDAVRAFLAASIHGWDDFMNGDPAPAKALIAKRNEQMSAEFMDYSIRAMRERRLVAGKPELGERLGQITRKRMRDMADLMIRLKIVPGPMPLDRFVSFEFLPPDLKAAAGD